MPLAYPTTTPLDPSIYDPHSGVAKFGANLQQQQMNNQAISGGNQAYQTAMTNYNQAMQNWNQNKGVTPQGQPIPKPTAPDPNQIYHAATNVNQYNAGLPGGGASVGTSSTTPWSLSQSQAQGLSPTSPAGSPGGGGTMPARLPIGASRPGSQIPMPGQGQPSPTSPAGQAPNGVTAAAGGDRRAGSPATPGVPAPAAPPPAPGATTPGGPAAQQHQATGGNYQSPTSPSSVGAPGQVGPSTAGTPTYNPTSPSNYYSGSQAGLNFATPFGSGMSINDEVSNPTGLTQQIVSGYNNAVGGGQTLQNRFGGYADANAQRTASLQNQLASAYAPIAAGHGGYTQEQASSILQQPGLDALPTSEAALQSNFLTPEEQQQIGWTPQNTQDLLAQNATSIQAGTQAQKDAIDIAAVKQGASSPLQVQAMKDRAQQAGLAATGDSQTNARLAAATKQEQQAQTLAQNRQATGVANQQTQYNQGMDINAAESGRNTTVANANIAAGQEYRNQYLGGQEQQASQNTQVGNQQQLGAYTSQGAATNQANQVGVANQNTPTEADKIIGDVTKIGQVLHSARGNVVGGPEKPMQGPKPALVGEAGPEAIVPLGPPRINLRSSPLIMRRPGRMILGGGMDRVRAMGDGGAAVPYGGGDGWDPTPMALGDVGDPYGGGELDPQYTAPTNSGANQIPAQEIPKTPAQAEQIKNTNPSLWQKLLTMAVGHGALSQIIKMVEQRHAANGGGGSPTSPAGGAGQNGITAPGGQAAPAPSPLSTQQQNDSVSGQAFYNNIMHNPDPGELAPMSFVNINSSNSTGGGGTAAKPAARPAPATTGHERPVPTASQQHPTTPQPSIPNMTSTFPSTGPTTPTSPAHVDTSLPTPPPLQPTVSGQVPDYRIPTATDTNIHFDTNNPVPEPGMPNITSSWGSGGEEEPPDIGNQGPSTPDLPGGYEPAPIPGPASTIGQMPGEGYPDTGGVSMSNPGSFSNSGSGWQPDFGGGGEIQEPWFGSDNGLPSGNAKGAVYAPPQTPYGPTQVVDKPTYLTLGENQPEAVVPLTDRKDAKVKPKDIPKLTARYGRK